MIHWYVVLTFNLCNVHHHIQEKKYHTNANKWYMVPYSSVHDHDGRYHDEAWNDDDSFEKPKDLLLFVRVDICKIVIDQRNSRFLFVDYRIYIMGGSIKIGS